MLHPILNFIVMFSKSPNKVIFAHLHRTENDVKVQPHLAYDVSDLAQMVQMGKPISTTSAENMYYDGSSDVSFNLPLDKQRGVDLNDMFQAAASARKKLSKIDVKLKSK